MPKLFKLHRVQHNFREKIKEKTTPKPLLEKKEGSWAVALSPLFQ